MQTPNLETQEITPSSPEISHNIPREEGPETEQNAILAAEILDRRNNGKFLDNLKQFGEWFKHLVDKKG